MRDIIRRADWRDAVQKTHRLFTGRDHAGEPLETRIVFYLQMLEDRELLAPGKTIVDLGAGIYWFDPMVKLLGSEVVLVDDFGGGGGVDNADPTPALQMIARYRNELNIKVVEQDFLETPLAFPDASVDGVTCFHSLEHWHHSPKNLFREIARILRPGGYLFLATPNAVNIRKRITVPLGFNNWAGLEEWYHEQPHFRGHVREPIVGDLEKIMEWNGLRVDGVYGRNFIGRDSLVLSWLPRPLRHGLAAVTQLFLRFFPTLCSDIHVVGRKPA